MMGNYTSKNRRCFHHHRAVLAGRFPHHQTAFGQTAFADIQTPPVPNPRMLAHRTNEPIRHDRQIHMAWHQIRSGQFSRAGGLNNIHALSLQRSARRENLMRTLSPEIRTVMMQDQQSY
jgi:hypothetical protein